MENSFTNERGPNLHKSTPRRTMCRDRRTTYPGPYFPAHSRVSFLNNREVTDTVSYQPSPRHLLHYDLHRIRYTSEPESPFTTPLVPSLTNTSPVPVHRPED